MARPRSIRWRYTLRGFFVVLTLFCIWAGVHAGPAWKERRALAILQRHDCQLIPQPDRGNRNLWSYLSTAYNQSGGALWGQRFNWGVSVSDRLEPDLVEALALIPDIEVLSLQPSELPGGARHQPQEAIPLPEGALTKILSTHELKYLYIEGFLLSAEDFDMIAAHPSVEVLSICGTTIGEDSLAKLVALPRLISLTLERNTPLQGAKLTTVPGSTSLKGIGCNGTRLGRDFAAYVARCPNVQTLDVGSPSIDDEFLAQLAGHAALEGLDLLDCNVTDASITPIGSLPALKWVSLPRGGVSANGMLNLKLAKPKLAIVER
jgi:hypothetical protein